MSSLNTDRLAEIVSRWKAGDDAAFDELVRLMQRPIFNLAYRMLNDYEEVRDAVQDIFIKVYKSLNKYRADSSFSSWFYAVAKSTRAGPGGEG